MKIIVLTPLPSPFVEQGLERLRDKHAKLKVMPVFYGDASHRLSWGEMQWEGLWLHGSGLNRVRMLAAYVNEHKPDQVVLGQYNRVESWWLKRYASRNKIPVHVLFLEPLIPSSRLKYKLKLVAFKKFLSGVTSVGCMGRRAFSDYSQIYKGHIFDCPYSFDLKHLLEIDGAKRRKDCTTYLYSGRLIAFRDPLLTVRCFAKVKERSTSKVHLIISGKGDLEEALIREIERLGLVSDVTWMNDFKDWEDIRNLYRHADVLLSLGFFNTWSLTIQEAMAAGMGVVATHTTEAANTLLLNEFNGYLVDHDNVASIVEAMLSYAESSGLAAEHGKRSREIVDLVGVDAVSSRIARALSL